MPETTWRERVGERSAHPLALVARQPKWLIVVAIALVTVGGFALPGIFGAALLWMLAALLAWLVVLGWDHAPATGRALRVAVIVAIVAFAISKLT